ncbi:MULTISPECIES: DUF1835 domain-containing protein [Paenibacillus]|uniref:DUF1835 domain-containing protein n=1 Tax=Paenibacillus TaxID=44249 RepID=UPI002FE253A8
MGRRIRHRSEEIRGIAWKIIEIRGVHIDKLDERMKEFGNGEYRLILRQLLETANQEEHLYTLLEKYIEAIHKHRIQAEQRQTYVHLVFSLSNAGSLKVALSKLNRSEGHRVVAFNELFSVGPIADLNTLGGQRNRELWMMEHLPDTFFGASSNQEHRIDDGDVKKNSGKQDDCYLERG